MEKAAKKEELKQKKALVTSRVLFVSVLDKIYLVILLLTFAGLTYNNFMGDIASSYYNFWARVGLEIVIIIGVFIYYLFLNWLYRCVAKTMLCLTETEVYKEQYVPFKRSEISIPLNKITGVSTLNVFWIFRSVTIHQYGRLPMVFFTWNNQEFKDKLNELITKNKEKVENKHKSKNLIAKENLKYVLFGGIGLAGLIFIIGMIRLFCVIFSPENKIPGTYRYSDNEIVLKSNGTCELEGIEDNVTSCNWEYYEYSESIKLDYTYNYYSYYYGYTKTSENTEYVEYDAKNQTLTLDGDVYKK